MRVILRKKQSLSKSQEAVDGVSRVYNVPRVVLSFSRSPLTPTSAQGISAREDAMTGFLLAYRRCFDTGMDDSTWPVSVKAERTTFARLSYLRCDCSLCNYIIYFPSGRIFICLPVQQSRMENKHLREDEPTSNFETFRVLLVRMRSSNIGSSSTHTIARPEGSRRTVVVEKTKHTSCAGRAPSKCIATRSNQLHCSTILRQDRRPKFDSK